MFDWMKQRAGIAVAVLAAAGLFGAIRLSHAADPSALWHIIDGRCIPHEEQAHDPSPCSKVDLSEGRQSGYVVLKDINGASQFLLMPTARIHGIESAEILAADAANYWDLAWQSRYFVEERLQHLLTREDVALAINSDVGRTQDQLHIHIDCVRPDVQAALVGHLAQIGPQWAPFPAVLAGHSYRAMRLEQENLGDKNPFRLLADADPKAAEDMGNHTLVVVGATFPGNVLGFVLLDDHADLAAGDHASGEELQDHSCALAKAG
ncbi:MAG: CDP-diacylglycerol diphosphatase [Acetobacteraceae bacterium]|nr:CDP-diacylglycerol diphosphatase [Acetobacteraceae bacterium]